MSRPVARMLSVFCVALFLAGVGGPAGAAPKTPPGDPPGNNGTVKIDQSDKADEDKGNEPIGDDCLFWLEFYGFDNGQKADITFAAQPPTGGKDPITDKGNGFGQPGDGVLISDDAAGGGQDADATVPYNLSAYVNGLTPHPQHGYHIKLTTTIKNADGSAVPGGVKHKVFWIKCAPTQPTTLRVAKATQGNAPQGSKFTFTVSCNHRPLEAVPPFDVAAGDSHDITGIPVGTTCVVTESSADHPPVIEEKRASGAADGANDGKIVMTAGAVNLVKFTNLYEGSGGTPLPPDVETRPPAGTPDDATVSGATGGTGTEVPAPNPVPSASPGTAVLGETATAPEATATLPRTGNDPRPLTGTGLFSLVAGVALLAVGRRRRS